MTSQSTKCNALWFQKDLTDPGNAWEFFPRRQIWAHCGEVPFVLNIHRHGPLPQGCAGAPDTPLLLLLQAAEGSVPLARLAVHNQAKPVALLPSLHPLSRQR